MKLLLLLALTILTVDAAPLPANDLLRILCNVQMENGGSGKSAVCSQFVKRVAQKSVQTAQTKPAETPSDMEALLLRLREIEGDVPNSAPTAEPSLDVLLQRMQRLVEDEEAEVKEASPDAGLVTRATVAKNPAVDISVLPNEEPEVNFLMRVVREVLADTVTTDVASAIAKPDLQMLLHRMRRVVDAGANVTAQNESTATPEEPELELLMLLVRDILDGSANETSPQNSTSTSEEPEYKSMRLMRTVSDSVANMTGPANETAVPDLPFLLRRMNRLLGISSDTNEQDATVTEEPELAFLMRVVRDMVDTSNATGANSSYVTENADLPILLNRMHRLLYEASNATDQNATSPAAAPTEVPELDLLMRIVRDLLADSANATTNATVATAEETEDSEYEFLMRLVREITGSTANITDAETGTNTSAAPPPTEMPDFQFLLDRDLGSASSSSIEQKSSADMTPKLEESELDFLMRVVRDMADDKTSTGNSANLHATKVKEDPDVQVLLDRMYRLLDDDASEDAQNDTAAIDSPVTDPERAKDAFAKRTGTDHYGQCHNAHYLCISGGACSLLMTTSSFGSSNLYYFNCTCVEESAGVTCVNNSAGDTYACIVTWSLGGDICYDTHYNILHGKSDTYYLRHNVD